MKSATAGTPGFHHRQRRAEFDAEETPPAVQREKISSTGSSSRRVLDHGPGKEAAETTSKNRLLERKPTEDINESAEAFINKFRQQLLLQRLESIENYEQMLRRGT